MSDKKRVNCSKDDIFRVLDMIEILQSSQNEQKTLYVPKRLYKIARKMLKIDGKARNVKIKTY